MRERSVSEPTTPADRSREAPGFPVLAWGGVMEDSLDWKGWTDHFSKMSDRRVGRAEFKQ